MTEGFGTRCHGMKFTQASHKDEDQFSSDHLKSLGSCGTQRRFNRIWTWTGENESHGGQRLQRFLKANQPTGMFHVMK